MTQLIQTVACIVDTVLILCFFKYIISQDFKTTNLLFPIAFSIPFSILGGFIDFYLMGNIGSFPIKLLFPLCFVLIAERGSLSKKFVNYFLSLLLFMSAEILSIFIELFIFSTMVGNAASNNRFLLVSILVNSALSLFIWRQGSKGNLHITLSTKEWVLLFCVNSITYLLISAAATEKKIILMQTIPQEVLTITIHYSAIFLYIFFVISLVNGRIAAHFKEINQIREQHMAEQLKYFSSYRHAQEDLRRFRHDMKNHLLYLQALSSDNKTDDMIAYIKSLNERWDELPRLYFTGNDVVDTIINAKQFMYTEHRIHLEIKGSFHAHMLIAPIDLCTIFSNAIDNAVHANAILPASVKRFIEIDIKATRNIYLVIIQNPLCEVVIVENNRVLSPHLKEKGHGYGLLNIEQSLKSYGGYMKLNTNSSIFTLEIVFPK